MSNIEYVNDAVKEINLNKWPGCVIMGKDVTELQAAEIIFRTDPHLPDFKYASNDTDFEKELNVVFGFPHGDDDGNKYSTGWVDRSEKLFKQLKKIPLEYMHTDRILTCYVGGPNGWCSWSGKIFTNNKNIGKWPSVEDVAEDWGKIAKAFPFLQLYCQLMDKESCEDGAGPIVRFEVQDGQVKVTDNVDPLIPSCDTSLTDILGMTRPDYERGITIEQFKFKLLQVYGKIPQYTY
jgi:hypothetical protein